LREREKFSSRLSFIVVSVSCAVGLGNIWLLLYRAGMFGGGLYILMFLAFAFLLAIPVLTTEYAVGRGSGRSIATHYQVLEPKGSKWHLASYLGMAGNYLLMMFYTVVCGLALAYVRKGAAGSLIGQSPEYIAQSFGALVADPAQMVGFTLVIVFAGFAACYLGLNKGVERVGKYMMLVFFILIVVLIGRSLTLPGAFYGLRFIFVPDPASITEHGFFTIMHMAMGQALFSLSVGIGAMAIFGSYISKQKRLFGEAATVGVIDLCVSILCLLMIFPAAFAFGIAPTTGQGLIFVTMPNIFNHMPGTYIWSLMFYIGLAFVSFSTAVAVYENIVAISMDKFGWTRRKSTLVNVVVISVLCMPAALGTNLWSHIQPFGFANFSALFSFIVSDNLLPIGSIIYVVFCCSRRGWGFNNFLAEINTGDGIKFPTALRFYITYIIPPAIFFIFIFGHINRFLL